MAEVKTFKCDRCGKTIYGPADYEVAVFTIQELYAGSPKDAPSVKTLCDDCDTAYGEFFREWKQFDALANKTIKSLPIER